MCTRGVSERLGRSCARRAAAAPAPTARIDAAGLQERSFAVSTNPRYFTCTPEGVP